MSDDPIEEMLKAARLHGGDEASEALEALLIEAGVVEPERKGMAEDGRTLVEADSEQELQELQTGFLARAKQEQGRFEDATDSEYWVCLCFQSRAQREEFARKSGLFNDDEKYVDGMKVARLLEIELETAVREVPTYREESALKLLT